MNSPKSILYGIASFIIVGLFVLLIDFMYPTDPINKTDFQAYSSKNLLKELDK